MIDHEYLICSYPIKGNEKYRFVTWNAYHLVACGLSDHYIHQYVTEQVYWDSLSVKEIHPDLTFNLG